MKSDRVIPIDSEWTLCPIKGESEGNHVQVHDVVPDGFGGFVAECRYLKCVWSPAEKVGENLVNLDAEWLKKYGKELNQLERRNAAFKRVLAADSKAAAKARGLVA